MKTFVHTKIISMHTAVHTLGNTGKVYQKLVSPRCDIKIRLSSIQSEQSLEFSVQKFLNICKFTLHFIEFILTTDSEFIKQFKINTYDLVV